jgi:hypothetical protein
MQMHEAVQTGRVRDAAMDVLVRSVNRFMPNGWGGGPDPVWELAQTFSEFGTIVALNAKTSEVDLLVRQVFEALKASRPPHGWLPASAADRFIQEAFAHGWSLAK